MSDRNFILRPGSVLVARLMTGTKVFHFLVLGPDCYMSPSGHIRMGGIWCARLGGYDERNMITEL